MKFNYLLLIPPAVGAIIGYITNVVAVRMLFRPLKEYRLFGIRVPFTPGILPKERHKLALSIGRMVETELLTPEILRERLARPDVLESLTKALGGYTEKIFDMPAQKWLPGISGYAVKGASALYPHAASAVIGFLEKKQIRESIEAQLRIIISKAILNLNVFQRIVISAGQYDKTLDEKVPDIVNDLISQLDILFKSDEGEKKIIGTIENEINNLPKKRPDLSVNRLLVPLESWTGPDSKNRIDTFMAEKILKTAEDQIDVMLKTINVRLLVSDRIDSLDMKRVEKIILDVMAGQLWWINIFGGILGFLIGLFESFMSMFL